MAIFCNFAFVQALEYLKLLRLGLRCNFALFLDEYLWKFFYYYQRKILLLAANACTIPLERSEYFDGYNLEYYEV